MKNTNIDYLDGWRGLAISFLLIGHFFPYWRFRLGTFGVDLFFVLSGLLMSRLLFIKRTPISTFYRRRISRIFPSLYFFVVAMVVYYLSFIKVPIFWNQVTGSVFLIRNYFPVEFGNQIPFDHIWSLSVEEHSYILLTLLVLLSGARIRTAQILIGFVCLLSIAAGLWYSNTHAPTDFYAIAFRHTEVAAFGIFASAFFLLYFRHGIEADIPWFVFPLLFLIAIGTYYIAFPVFFGRYVGVGALALLVNILHKAPNWMRKIISIRILRAVGLCSFSIYLWQQPFYKLHNLGLIPPVIALTLSVCAGALSYFLIEKPCREYLNNNWGKQSVP